MGLQKFGWILFLSLLGSFSPPLLLDFPIIFSASPVVAQTSDARKAEAYRLLSQGIDHSRVSRFQEALQSWQKALTIYREIEDRQGEANSLGNLGIAYHNLGQYQQAIDYHHQSLAIKREIGDSLRDSFASRNGEASSLGNLGNAYYFLGQYQEMIDYYQQSLAITREIGDSLQDSFASRQWEASSLNNLGNAYYSLGHYREAIDYYQQSLTIKREIGDHLGKAKSLNNLGNAYYSLGQYQQAIDYHQQSLAMAREIGDREGVGISLNNLGYPFFKSGNLTAAETTLIKAINVYESLRTNLEHDHKVSIFREQARSYRLLQQVLIAQDKTHAALEIAERGRTRALAELLANGLSPKSDTLPIYPNLDKIQQIARQQNATLVEYSIIFDEELYIWVISPTGEIQFRQVELPQDTSLQQLVNNGRACILDSQQCRSDSQKLTFSPGDLVRLKDDADYGLEEPWKVIEFDAESDTLTLTHPQFDNIEVTRPIADFLSRANSPHAEKQRLQKLHQLLIQPIADLLPKNENDRIIFIPHEELFLVPFAALQDEQENYLIQKHTILTAPSIDILGLTHEQRQNTPDSVQGALVIGNPTMPKVRKSLGEEPQQLSHLTGAEDEAKAIASQLNAQLLLGNQATETAVKGQLKGKRYIHFATHGLLNENKGIESAIALAPSSEDDGLLSAEEIFDLELNAELVVVSACDTGQGDITGDGVIGLSYSLIRAKVPSVIVSLWAVPDESTAELMIQFYQNLENTNDKAQALRQAMLDTIEKHPNPKDWAAFTLIGEAF
ncbi:MAG: CHAT domain-containing protein [Symploca sp. SIO2E9]|nr:CHAT domain-containing protein [Symploca sp. SIO2E9]